MLIIASKKKDNMNNTIYARRPSGVSKKRKQRLMILTQEITSTIIDRGKNNPRNASRMFDILFNVCVLLLYHPLYWSRRTSCRYRRLWRQLLTLSKILAIALLK